MVTIDLGRILQTVGVWLSAVVLVFVLLSLGSRSARWGKAVIMVLWLLAVTGAAAVLWEVLR